MFIDFVDIDRNLAVDPMQVRVFDHATLAGGPPRFSESQRFHRQVGEVGDVFAPIRGKTSAKVFIAIGVPSKG